MNDKHQALRDAVTMKELLEAACRSGEVGVGVAELRALLADHDWMRGALQSIADTPTCDCCGGSLEGAVYAAELALKECEQ
jgi:hypothetical protein